MEADGVTSSGQNKQRRGGDEIASQIRTPVAAV
jgi:hypothetical protein